MKSTVAWASESMIEAAKLKVFVWLGVRKQTGCGEDASNLSFDQIVYTPEQTG